VLRFAPLLFFLMAASASAAPFTAFRDGETFTYRVGFAFFSHAGDIVIAAMDDKGAGRDLVRITTDTRSNGIVRGLYEFDNRAEVVLDRPTSRLQSVKESGADPKRATDTEFVVDYEKRTARFTDRVRPERSAELALPEGGDPIDLISALVQTRDWNLQPGQKRDVVVQFGRDFYPLAIHAENYETVRTPLGRYKALVLVPRMEKDPKGVFKRGGEIKVWIAQDGSRLPVKMQLRLKFGAATLLLSKYQAPSSQPGE
jgi:hypothetical protein